MARRHLGEPLYEMRDRNHSWGAGRLLIAMVVVLALVLTVLFGGMPLSPMEGFSNRQARKLLKDAQSWEQESLYHTAAEQYEKVSSNPKIKKELRTEAAQRLAVLQRDYLHNPAAAEAALEKAYHFAANPQRAQLRADLEALRGSPIAHGGPATGKTGPLPATATADVSTSAPLSPDDLAIVGNQRVTLQDVLFAWTRLNGKSVPTPETLQPFVKQYLDMVLMADEAQRRGIDARGRTSRDLKLNRLMTLNTAMAQSLVEELKTPDAATLEKFYHDHEQLFAGPAILRLLPLVVRDADKARQVATALEDGEDFDALVKRYGVGGPGLRPGESFEVNSADPSIKMLNDQSGLPLRLARLAAGETTGPLQTARGLAFFKLLEKSGATAPPFAEVRDQVLMAYQRQAVAVQNQVLLNQLRQTRPIKINTAGLSSLAAEKAPETDTADTTTSATAQTADKPE
jgi:hypothetical protein